MTAENRRRAVFLDRDGTINVEVSYLGDPNKMVLLPGVAEAIGLLNRASYSVVVVTNQAGIARGYYDERAMHAVHARISAALREAGAWIDAFFFCPHHPELTGPCGCRKPAPGMLRQAAAELGLDLTRSWVIGDTVRDIGAGAAVGCGTILVRTGYGAEQERDPSLWQDGLRPSWVADNLPDAARYIVGLAAGHGRKG